MHKKSPSQANYNSKLLQLELLQKNPMFSIKTGCDFHSLYTWHLSVVKATGGAHSWGWVLFPTASPQWLCFFPQPLVNQIKKTMKEELIFWWKEWGDQLPGCIYRSCKYKPFGSTQRRRSGAKQSIVWPFWCLWSCGFVNIHAHSCSGVIHVIAILTETQ